MSRSLKEKAVRGAGANIASSFLGFLFHFLGVMILARLIIPEHFGLVAMVTAFSVLPMNFGVNGFIGYIIQKEKIVEEEINAILWLHIFIAVILAIGFCGFGYFLVYFFSEPALKNIAIVMSSSFIILALTATPRALLWRDMKFSYVAFGDLIGKVISIGLAIALAFYGMAYWAIVARQIVSPLISMIVAWWLCPWRPQYPHALKKAIPGLKYALKIFGTEAVDYLGNNVDRMILGKYFGTTTLGHYDRAGQLTSIPASQLISPATSVAQATLSRLKDDTDKYAAYYLKAVSMVSFIGISTAVFLLLASDDLVPLILGSGWSETAIILKALSPSIAAILLYSTIAWLHISLGTPGRWLRWNIFARTLTITFFFVAVSFGAVAVAATYSVSMYILVLPGLWYAGRPIQLRILSVVRSIGPYLSSGILTYLIWFMLPVYSASINNLFTVLNPLIRVILTGCLALFTYVLIVSIIQRNFSSLREAIELFKMMVSRRKQ